LPVQDGCLLRDNDYSNCTQAPKSSVEAQGCQGTVLRVHHLVLFTLRSGNIPAAASAVRPRRGSQAALAQLHSLFSASRRASARYSSRNYSLVLSLQLPRFPGSCMIARINVTFMTCIARAIFAAPWCNWCVPPPPASVSGGFLWLRSWCPAAGGQREPRRTERRSITIFSQNWAFTEMPGWELNFPWDCESSPIRSCIISWITMWGWLIPHKKKLVEVSQCIKQQRKYASGWQRMVLSHWILSNTGQDKHGLQTLWGCHVK